MKVKELKLKNVDPNEVFAGLDAIDAMAEHSDEDWVRRFLDEHGIVREAVAR